MWYNIHKGGKMEEEILKSIDRKLEALIKILAGNFIRGKSKTDAILTLGGFGIEANVIADIVRTTVATVNARLWEQKKKSGSVAKKSQKKEVEQ